MSAQDITGASATLETSLTQDVNAAYQAKLQDSESLLTPVSCQAQVHVNHPRGSEAKQVTVSVSERCQGAAYNAAQVQALVSQAINQQSQAGGYQLDNRSLRIQVQLNNTHPGEVQVQGHGTLLYTWSQQQQRTLAALIAGKSQDQATAMLLQQPGVSSVSIALTGRDTGTLPSNPDRIHFVIIAFGQ